METTGDFMTQSRVTWHDTPGLDSAQCCRGRRAMLKQNTVSNEVERTFSSICWNAKGSNTRLGGGAGSLRYTKNHL